jgi:MYXO-CTERM domain-containing protein
MADVRTLPAQTSPDTGAAVDDDDEDGMDYGWVGLLGLLGLLGLRRRDHDHTHEVRVDPRGTAPPRT